MNPPLPESGLEDLLGFLEKPCVHHWLVGTPFVEWQGPELVEVTNQICKKCGDLKLNTVVLPREVVSDR